MRVSCLQENLAKGLSIVGRAVSSRSTLPVLGNILLEAKDNELRLAATNLEIGVNCWIGAKVTILDGVSIGEGCVIAAGAVVKEDIPPHSLVAGVPARLIRRLAPASAGPTSVVPAV